MKQRTSRFTMLAGALGASLVTAHAAPAAACGGFFCSQSQPVNQAAERILFAQNANGTVTAVIQILYEGPSEDFSWLLPIASVPDAEGEIAVASDIAFQRLQAATNPQYTLNTIVDGDCRSDLSFDNVSSGADPSSPNLGAESTVDFDDGGVTVAASGVVGAFDWTALELNASLQDPAGAALDWLTANGYDVLPQSAELIGPYLQSGMYLLALRLTKGADTGSIRPIVLTYDGNLPSIPIKLTAVAANDNMGVMAWMLSESRAVPFNYNALELNEARINWFNASANYESVVTAAADDSGGQGFVTEFAGASDPLAEAVWSEFEENEWQDMRSPVYSRFSDLFMTTYYAYGSFDGFWDVARAHVTLPPNVTPEDFELCPDCYREGITLSPTAYFAALEENVIQPVRLVRDLLQSRPYATRLYSTLSAADMTVDPVFTFNGDLPDVSNLHTADRIIECNPGLFQFEAPWRIELPQGGVIRGTPETFGTWPEQVADQPANFRVLTLSDTGTGLVTSDNSTQINDMLTLYNESVPAPVPYSAPSARNSGMNWSGDSGCGLARSGVTGTPPSGTAAAAAALLGLFWAQRRRQRTR
jgi:hypothetical protein